MIRVREAGALLTGAVAEAAGRLLAAGSWLRRARVFHPYGVVCTATLAPAAEAGVPAVVHTTLFGAADAQPRQVLVRLSKSAGTPGALPDLLGVAMRLEDGAQPVDFLFVTTIASRLLLAPANDWLAQPYSTVLPYRAGAALLWLGLLPRNRRDSRDSRDGDDGSGVPSSLDAVGEAAATGLLSFAVVVSGAVGQWRQVATLTITRPASREVSFDPVRNAHPLLTPVPRWIATVRSRSYTLSRRARESSRRSVTR